MKTYKILLAGDTGTGKTMQFETMPGPRYAHIFDPAAHNTLTLEEGEYDNFFPLPSEMSLLPAKGHQKTDANLYVRWAKHFQRQLNEGFFEKVGSFMLDSATVLGLALLNYQRKITDSKDERQHHMLAGETMIEALWAVFTLPCHVLVTMHTKPAEVMVGETKTGERTNKLTVPGGAQLMLPRLVSASWYTSLVESKNGGPRFMAMTRPQPRWPNVRTPRGWGKLELWHDLTIEDMAHPERYGVGALIARGE